MDTLRSGTAPQIIRRKGAEGNLPVPLSEKIEILILLCGDDDPTIRNTAFETLKAWNSQDLRQILSDPSTPLAVLDFAVGYLAPDNHDAQEGLLQNPQLPPDLREWVQSLAIRPEGFTTAPSSLIAEAADQEIEPKDSARQTLLQKIARMSTVEKIKIALTGSQEERMILIRDSNKIVARAVLQSPKLSDQEIEGIASMKNVTEEVLRLVATNRRFKKNYSVIRALVNNPRAPIDVTMHLVNHLSDRDQKALSVNKNVPDVLRTIALKLIRQRLEAQKIKLPTKR